MSGPAHVATTTAAHNSAATSGDFNPRDNDTRSEMDLRLGPELAAVRLLPTNRTAIVGDGLIIRPC